MEAIYQMIPLFTFYVYFVKHIITLDWQQSTYFMVDLHQLSILIKNSHALYHERVFLQSVSDRFQASTYPMA